MVRLDKNTKENLEAMALIMLITIIDVICLWMDFSNYIDYKMHASEYTVTLQEVTRIVPTSKVNNNVYFEYEINGKIYEGCVGYTYSDYKGKNIRVAFDKNMNYIRPDILIEPSMFFDIILTLITGCLDIMAIVAVFTIIIRKIKSICNRDR